MNPSKINKFKIGDSVLINPRSNDVFAGERGIIVDLYFRKNTPFAEVRIYPSLSAMVFLGDLRKDIKGG